MVTAIIITALFLVACIVGWVYTQDTVVGPIFAIFSTSLSVVAVVLGLIVAI